MKVIHFEVPSYIHSIANSRDGTKSTSSPANIRCNLESYRKTNLTSRLNKVENSPSVSVSDWKRFLLKFTEICSVMCSNTALLHSFSRDFLCSPHFTDISINMKISWKNFRYFTQFVCFSEEQPKNKFYVR